LTHPEAAVRRYIDAFNKGDVHVARHTDHPGRRHLDDGASKIDGEWRLAAWAWAKGTSCRLTRLVAGDDTRLARPRIDS